jgi:ClpX C4-type zinc finger
VDGTERPLRHDHIYALRDEEAYLQADDEKPEAAAEPFDAAPLLCQFCGRPWEQVSRLFEAKRRVRDPNTSALAAVYVCDQCVGTMARLLAEQPPESRSLWGWQLWLGGGRVHP